MKKLSEKRYWDGIYEKGRKQNTGQKASLRNERQAYKSYSDYILWESLFEKYLPAMNGQTKVLEVGSAPGKFLIEMRNKYGIDPYGVEYSPAGTEINKKNFEEAGISPTNIFNDDFFSPSFQQRQQASYDIVVSRGFIEHFDDIERVIDAHLNLLKPNGILVITIPNLRGINYGLLTILHKELIAIHNLNIMKPAVFKKLFNPQKIQSIYNGFFGTFDFAVLNAKAKPFPQFLYKAGMRVQQGLSGLFKVILNKRMMNSQYTSPYLIYIGKKI